jgi:hypothetical protein
VLKDGKIVFERYMHGADEHTLLYSGSVAKAFTSTLVGFAIGDGSIYPQHPRLAGERAIVEGVLTTCKCLGIRTVAEMVEKEDQHRILLDLGVGLGRAGYRAVRRPRSRFGKRLGAKEMWG